MKKKNKVKGSNEESLAGSADGADGECNFWSQGCELESHIGCRY